MSEAHSVGVTLGAIALAQSVVALVLAQSELFKPVYARVLDQQTNEYRLLGVRDFFQEKDLRDKRIDAVAGMGSLAGTVTAQLQALLVAAGGSLAFLFAAQDHGGGWAVASLVAMLLSAAAFVLLLYRALTGGIANFHVTAWPASTPGLLPKVRASGENLVAWETPTPYVAIVFLVGLFSVVAGILLA